MHMSTLPCLGQSLKDHWMYGQMFHDSCGVSRDHIVIFISSGVLWEFVLGCSSFIDEVRIFWFWLQCFSMKYCLQLQKFPREKFNSLTHYLTYSTTHWPLLQVTYNCNMTEMCGSSMETLMNVHFIYCLLDNVVAFQALFTSSFWICKWREDLILASLIWMQIQDL